MSKSSRDQRGRPHSSKKCPESAAGGCVWCGTGYAKRPARRQRRSAQRAVIRAEIRSERD